MKQAVGSLRLFETMYKKSKHFSRLTEIQRETIQIEKIRNEKGTKQ